MKMRNKKGFATRSHAFIMLIMVLIIITTIIACSRHKDLSEKPERSSTVPTFKTEPSTIGALVEIPISEIAAMVNKSIPDEFSDSGHGEDVCGRILGQKVCAGTHYSFRAKKAGQVSISAFGDDTLRATLPIDFKGDGGLRGAGARFVKIDKKNFKGAVTAIADIKAKLTKEWCPELDAKMRFDWRSNPKVEIVHKIWVDVKGQVEGKLKEKLRDLENSAKNAIDCATVKNEIAKIYSSQTFPIDLPGKSEAHVNIVPTDIGFSGLQMSKDKITFAATITTKAEVSRTALIPVKLPFPPVKNIPISVPQTKISLPVRAPYETLEALLRSSLGGKTYSAETTAGKVEVAVKDVELYPSDSRLVVGVDMEANLPSTLFDIAGTVFLLATPVIHDGTSISFADIGFARKLDNRFWDTATVVFEGPIKDTIREAANYDLSADINNLNKRLSKKLSDLATKSGIEISLTNVSMNLGRVVVADNELAVEALFSANAILTAKK